MRKLDKRLYNALKVCYAIKTNEESEADNDRMEPVKLVCDGEQAAKCPRCGEALTLVKGQPVRVVEGKLNMQDCEDHFKCAGCKAVYRPILHTEYYQLYAE